MLLRGTLRVESLLSVETLECVSLRMVFVRVTADMSLSFAALRCFNRSHSRPGSN